MKIPADRDIEKITWVTNTKVQPNKIISCQGCNGMIMFNAEEILYNKSHGMNTSTPCRYCGWHPGYPPEPWLDYDGKRER